MASSAIDNRRHRPPGIRFRVVIFAMAGKITRSLIAGRVNLIGRAGVVARPITKIKAITHRKLKVDQAVLPRIIGRMDIMTGYARRSFPTYMQVM